MELKRWVFVDVDVGPNSHLCDSIVLFGGVYRDGAYSSPVSAVEYLFFFGKMVEYRITDS